MRIFKTRSFDKWAAKEGLTDAALRAAVEEMAQGLVDTGLGGHVYKKRVGLPGRGKSGGARTLLAYRVGSKAFFVYGYAKNERDNIDERELKTLKRLAAVMLSWDDAMLKQALAMGKLSEVINDD
jgi:hypothetical protein